MRIVRYSDSADQIRFAQEPIGGVAMELEGELFTGLRSTDRPATIQKRLAPLVPTAILCIGLNYRKHAEETGAKLPPFPVLFIKAPGALQNPGDPIVLPRHLRSEQVDFEGELAVIIGKACKNVSRDRALEYVLGYACGNDVSARDWQKQWGGGQWCRGKSFDTFCPLGPALVTPDEIPDPNALEITTRVNGQIMQRSSTADMIFKVPALIEFLSGSTTLLPGTIILTGTPSGVGMARTPPVWLTESDEVTVEIDGIGMLANPVTEESS